jgi:hypothetical protein
MHCVGVLVAGGQEAVARQVLEDGPVDRAGRRGAVGQVDHGHLAAGRHVGDPQVHLTRALLLELERPLLLVVGDAVHAVRRAGPGIDGARILVAVTIAIATGDRVIVPIPVAIAREARKIVARVGDATARIAAGVTATGVTATRIAAGVTAAGVTATGVAAAGVAAAGVAAAGVAVSGVARDRVLVLVSRETRNRVCNTSAQHAQGEGAGNDSSHTASPS